MRRLALALLASLAPLPAAAQHDNPAGPAALDPREVHLRNLRQITFGGENAEAYWAPDGQRLSMQATTPADRCDQIYTVDVAPALRGAPGRPVLYRVTDGRGRHTCSYFFPDASRLLFSSTRDEGPLCPPPVDRSKGYVWPLYHYQIYTTRPDGSDLQRLTRSPGYDAESTICQDGTVVFTSDRDGDLELYRMNLDGSGVKRLTFAPGYDGGAFFSRDCKRIVWRADRPRNDKERAEVKDLLKQHVVRPTRMEIWVADADGSHAHPVTELGAASFAPYFMPDGKRIIFSSNHNDPHHREFDLWAINDDGTKLERITYAPEFDGFPMFSPDGKHLAFSSNRGGKVRGETNVFIADWVDPVMTRTTYVPTRADRAASQVAWLADPARQGRGVGTGGLTQAGEQIAKWMQEAQLQPGAGKGFFQPVEVVVGVRDTGSRFTFGEAAGGKAQPLQAADLGAAPMSESGAFSGELVFAGYGISAPAAKWDDLAGVSVKDKVAVVLRGVPEKHFPAGAARSYSDLRYKAWNLREHGAKAVVFLDPEKPEVPKLVLDGPEGGAGLPVLHMGRGLVAKVLPGDDALTQLRQAAGHQQAFHVALRGVLSGTVALRRETRTERNVIGLLKGEGPGVVVLGAHYDHLGLGGRGSFEPDRRVVHPGADDNASGVAGMLTAAALLAEGAKDKPLPFDLYFVAFTGEEVGLVGSSRFIQALPAGLRPERLRAMFNFDMIGRLGSHPGATLPALVVQGTDSAKEWSGIVTPICDAMGLACKEGGDGYGPSDMTPFYAAGVPVLFFFTGAHTDYHRPSDTADKINAMGIVEVAEVAGRTVRALGDQLGAEGRLTFQRASGPMPRGGDSRGYGAYLGTIPDYTAMQGESGGVKLGGVRPGSPAEKAGLQGGDVLVGLAGHAVSTLEDMAYALNACKPGQAVEVIVMREGKRVAAKATLGARPH